MAVREMFDHTPALLNIAALVRLRGKTAFHCQLTWITPESLVRENIDCPYTRESVHRMLQLKDGGFLTFHMLEELFKGNHLTFTDSVKVTEVYVAVEKVARDLERLLATNDVECIRRNAQINNGSKYRNSYKTSIPSDKVWENGTSETLKDILKTIGSNQNYLLISHFLRGETNSIVSAIVQFSWLCLYIWINNHSCCAVISHVCWRGRSLPSFEEGSD
jgi:hypothetical protein